jgi:hypothetical protein
MSVRGPITTGPGRNRPHDLKVHGLRKRRYAHDAAANDGNADEIFQHAIGRNRRGRGANPQRRQAAPPRLARIRSGETVTCSCNPALQLLRLVPSIWIMPS